MAGQHLHISATFLWVICCCGCAHFPAAGSNITGVRWCLEGCAQAAQMMKMFCSPLGCHHIVHLCVKTTKLYSGSCRFPSVQWHWNKHVSYFFLEAGILWFCSRSLHNHQYKKIRLRRNPFTREKYMFLMLEWNIPLNIYKVKWYLSAGKLWL